MILAHNLELYSKNVTLKDKLIRSWRFLYIGAIFVPNEVTNVDRKIAGTTAEDKQLIIELN